MNKEEKEAIEFLKFSLLDYEELDTGVLENIDEKRKTLLNYIDKLQTTIEADTILLNDNLGEIEQLKHKNEELKDSINARFELQRRIDKTQKENAELKEEIKDLIEENHKHIDYIANMKKKHEDKIRTKIKELENKKEQYSERPLIYNILKSQLEELLGDDE